ncbi:MAG: TIGR00296 family protein [Methanobrevibacter sp.]|jgi:uncharacterized protein (TIGR00296 family)|nr:TIGR00296 family protein [Candidatus Methanoflexus mossambicus]
MFTENDGKFLLEYARKAIIEYLEFNKQIAIPAEIPDKFLENLGVFVTINKNNQLRGCIGYSHPVDSLIELTISSAIAAGFEDPRFPSLSPDEIKDIKLEITILTKPELIKIYKPSEYFDHIKVGKDGLIVEKGYNKGLLLPQVATEYGWDAKEFLEETCQKAGLPKDAYLEIDTLIYKFQGLIFKE